MKSPKKSLGKIKNANKYLSPPALLFAVLVAVILLQGFIDYKLMSRIDSLEDHVGQESSEQALHNFRGLAKEAAQMATLPVVPNQDNFVYIPELKIRMPLNSESRRLTYATNENEAAVSHAYAYQGLANDSQKAFEKMYCGRVAEISFAPSEEFSTNRDLQVISLADGRKMHVYTVDKEVCDSFISKIFVDEVVGALSQAQSY